MGGEAGRAETEKATERRNGLYLCRWECDADISISSLELFASPQLLPEASLRSAPQTAQSLR